MVAFFMAWLRQEVVLLTALAWVQISNKITIGTIFGVICNNYLQLYV